MAGTVTVQDAGTLQSIAVTPANPTVAKGLTQQFTATGTYSDGSTQDLTNQVTWASATTSVASISAAGLATAVSTGTSSISAALGGVSGSTVLTVAAAVLQSIAVTPADPTIAKGLTQQFTATGTYTDGSTQDLTNQVTWASATTSVASISAAGLATAVSTGTSSISAAMGGVSGSTVLTVGAAVLQSIAVTPADPTIATGLTQQFTATGTYSDNSTQDLSSQVTWASATTSVASISATGLATGAGTGTSAITATLGGVSGSTVLTVAAAVLQSIAVAPANPSIASGTTLQFTATGTYSDSSTKDLSSQVTWASATTSVASISASGLASALAAGTSSISATLGVVSGSTVLTVGAAVLQSIAVTPADPTIAKGLTQQFTATGTYSDNSTQDLTGQVTWTSATTSVATISAAGLATALDTGTSSISATLGSISGSTLLTIGAAALQSITVTPANPSIAAGTTLQFTATGTYSDNSTQVLTGQVTWASATASVATVTSSGLSTGTGIGTSTITATLGSVSGSTVLTVGAAVLQSIAVTPENPSIASGTTLQFTATGTYSDNSTQDLTSQVTWASSDTSASSISNAVGSSGLASGLATGTTTITAMLGGVADSTLLTVTAASLQSISVTPANPSIPVGEVQPFTATGTYTDGTTQDLSNKVTWASATTSVASIASDGLASGLTTGTSTISATMGTVVGSTVLTVTPAILEMIMITPDKPTVTKGQTQSFMAMGMYSDNSTIDLTEQVTWSSSNTTVATISNDQGSQGLATAVDDGTSQITATFEGISGSTTITVSTQDLNPVAARDNGQAGYYQYGIWSVSAGGLAGTHSSADPSTSASASARWLLNVSAGTYDVWATWSSGASNATNATYTVYDGFTNLGSAAMNQQLAPEGGRYGGVGWSMLGSFTVTAGRITVILSASGVDGDIIADGILLVPSTVMTMSESAMSGAASTASQATGNSNTTGSVQGVDIAMSMQESPGRLTTPHSRATTASIQTTGIVVVPSTTIVLSVDYTTNSEPSTVPGSTHEKSFTLSKHGLRRVAKRHQPIHESLIRRIASERVSHQRATGIHPRGD